MEHIKPHSHPHHGITYFASNLSVVIGIVLIWRGIWYMLDYIDLAFLGGDHMPFAMLGIILGVLILYLPDHDLKELGKL